jgi:hypothetical protein
MDFQHLLNLGLTQSIFALLLFVELWGIHFSLTTLTVYHKRPPQVKGVLKNSEALKRRII